jgi:hypothetical protein
MKAKNRPDKQQGTRCRRHTTAMGYYDSARQGVEPWSFVRATFSDLPVSSLSKQLHRSTDTTRRLIGCYCQLSNEHKKRL